MDNVFYILGIFFGLLIVVTVVGDIIYWVSEKLDYKKHYYECIDELRECRKENDELKEQIRELKFFK